MINKLLGIGLLVLALAPCVEAKQRKLKTRGYSLSARSGIASWHNYDKENKSYYRYGKMMAASTTYPCGTVLKVYNKANKKWSFVTIADWGPHPRLHRTLDLNKRVFNKIGNTGTGTMKITYYVVKMGNCKIHRH